MIIKHLKAFISISIISMLCYFSIIMIISANSNLTNILTTVIIPSILAANVIVAIPIAIQLNLQGSSKFAFIKRFGIFALIALIFANILFHTILFYGLAPSWNEGWIIIPVWLINISLLLAIMPLAVALHLVRIFHKKLVGAAHARSNIPFKSSLFNSASFLSSISMAWSIFLITFAIQGVWAS